MKRANEEETEPAPPWRDPAMVRHAGLLLRSYRRLLARDLLPPDTDEAGQARRLFEAPFAVLSHGVEDDPVLNYGNRRSLELWEMSFADFTRMPSRATAEPMLRQERERLLAIAAEKGFIDDYAGVRISSTGRRFRIENAIIWNLFDDDGRRRGQAATFDRWILL